MGLCKSHTYVYCSTTDTRSQLGRWGLVLRALREPAPPPNRRILLLIEPLWREADARTLGWAEPDVGGVVRSVLVVHAVGGVLVEDRAALVVAPPWKRAVAQLCASSRVNSPVQLLRKHLSRFRAVSEGHGESAEVPKTGADLLREEDAVSRAHRFLPRHGNHAELLCPPAA